MFHANTQTVIEDWNTRRGARSAPERTDISPAAFRHLLPQLFILGRDETGAEPFRLAGGLLVDLHARDLRGVCFFSLWSPADRAAVREALETARRSLAPVVLEASGWTAAGDSARLEIVLAPLVGPTGELDRVLGLYQPTSSVRRLMGAAIVALSLGEVRVAEPDSAAMPLPLPPRDRRHLRLAAFNGERVE